MEKINRKSKLSTFSRGGEGGALNVILRNATLGQNTTTCFRKERKLLVIQFLYTVIMRISFSFRKKADGSKEFGP